MSEFDIDDILKDTIALFGGESTEDDQICYGDLVLTVAPKVRIPIYTWMSCFWPKFLIGGKGTYIPFRLLNPSGVDTIVQEGQYIIGWSFVFSVPSVSRGNWNRVDLCLWKVGYVQGSICLNSEITYSAALCWSGCSHRTGCWLRAPFIALCNCWITTLHCHDHGLSRRNHHGEFTEQRNKKQKGLITKLPRLRSGIWMGPRCIIPFVNISSSSACLD